MHVQPNIGSTVASCLIEEASSASGEGGPLEGAASDTFWESIEAEVAENASSVLKDAIAVIQSQARKKKTLILVAVFLTATVLEGVKDNDDNSLAAINIPAAGVGSTTNEDKNTCPPEKRKRTKSKSVELKRIHSDDLICGFQIPRHAMIWIARGLMIANDAQKRHTKTVLVSFELGVGRSRCLIKAGGTSNRPLLRLLLQAPRSLPPPWIASSTVTVMPSTASLQLRRFRGACATAQVQAVFIPPTTHPLRRVPTWPYQLLLSRCR